MSNIIFSGYSVEIIQRDGRLYAIYDAGEIAIQMVEVEITGEEARQIQISGDETYKVLLKTQNEERPARRIYHQPPTSQP
jgi:hypothetical protein